MNTLVRPRGRLPGHGVRLRRLGIDTWREPVVFLRGDSHVVRSEGFEARTRLEVRVGAASVLATLQVVHGPLLGPGDAGLSESAWEALGAREGEIALVAHPERLASMGDVRAKIFGRRLDDAALRRVIDDVAAGRFSDVELAAFVAACAGDRLDDAEIVGLTRAMIDAGARLTWSRRPIVDKHCVGGLPGNRTTPVVVAIAASLGLCMPKTSSRAITSPAGTADAMETMAPVALDLAAVRRCVEREGACVVWGGAVDLSPADDVLIRVERSLDVDAEGQLVASILSKKVAAGSTHVLLDVPVGATAKVRDAAGAARLVRLFEHAAGELGLVVRVRVSDGSQPVGRGIGPALEAHDVLAVLRGDADAPADLRERSIDLAGDVAEMGGAAAPGAGRALAAAALASGRAWNRFQSICEAQGGMRTPPSAPHRWVVPAACAGTVLAVDCRRLARVAKLAGAPRAPAAGLEVHVRLGDAVAAGAPVVTVHAETPGELDYALDYLAREPDIVRIGDAP